MGWPPTCSASCTSARRRSSSSARATWASPSRCGRSRSGSRWSGSRPPPSAPPPCSPAARTWPTSPTTSSAARSQSGYRPVGDPADVGPFDVAVITVPTPLRDGAPDLSYVEDAAASLARRLRAGALVILESTTYPGTTDELVRPILEQSGLRSGRVLPRVLARAHRPRQRPVGLREHAQGGVGHRRAVSALRRGVLRRARRQGRAGGLDGRGRAGQAAREHLPAREHRARQRAGDVRRLARHRHLGRHRRRQLQAVRLHALHAGPRRRRALPSDRPVVPRRGG